MSLVRQQQRRDTTSNWELYNPVLLEGELGVDTTVDRFKIGDGLTVWTALPWFDQASVDAATTAQAAATAAAAAAQTAVSNGGVSGGDGVNSIVVLTQAQYNALSPVDPLTMYLVLG